MVYLITGASHTGKTYLAQRMLEALRIPYLSIDHLKMGLIRSGKSRCSPESPDELLTGELWPIVREIVRTVLENKQHLIVEGCNIPFDYRKDFSQQENAQIRFLCLIFSEGYIREKFDEIMAFENVIEQRKFPHACTKEELLRDHAENLRACRLHHCAYFLIEKEYPIGLSALQDILPPE